MSKRTESAEERSLRKELVKQQKAEKKARREGRGEEGYGQKPCTLCHQQKDLLIRCQIDKSGAWQMVCGRCWNQVSGGVVDGDEEHPDYRYGGLW